MNNKHLFSNKMLAALIVPVILEQILNSLMGTVDTIMVSNVGSSAISAVSLVDSINILVILAFAALGSGGAILCSQYIGNRDFENAREIARQLIFIVFVISLTVTVICIVFQNQILHLIFGSVEEAVMRDSKTYFFYTALSFPFIAMYNAGAGIFRSQENTRGPMLISISSNILNIGGNAYLIFGAHMGIAGAAIATLVSRIYSAVFVMVRLYNKNNKISVRNYLTIRPQGHMIGKILSLGIPSGVENSMFQFGKLAIQSSVSTLGTVAIAAQAMTNILENFSGMAAIGVGIGMMTVIGECIGAGRKDEAVYYIKKLSIAAEIIVIISCLLVYAAVDPVTKIGGMEAESARLCIYMTGWITVIKPICWTLAFIPAYGMRAAGDVKFSMTVSTMTMWLCRFCIAVVLIRVFGMGPMAVWIGMFSDWAIRALIFSLRFHSRKWLEHKVI